MTIRNASRKAGFAAIAMVLLAGIAMGLGVREVRVNGPVHERINALSAFTSDILPPPLFVTEAMLRVSDAANLGGALDEDKAELARLEREYHASRQRWAAADIDPALKSQLASGAGALADKFWIEVDQNLIPALERGDADAAAIAQGKARIFYKRHTAEIYKLAEQATRTRAALDANAARTITITLAVMTLAGLAVMAIVIVALRLLSGRVLGPLADTAGLMRAMAAGDLSQRPEGAERADEIGDMSRSIVHFRQAALDQREGAERQAFVVTSMGGALQEMASGNLLHRIDAPFASEYETLRAAYNQAAERLDQLVAQVSGSARDVNTGSGEIALRQTTLPAATRFRPPASRNRPLPSARPPCSLPKLRSARARRRM